MEPVKYHLPEDLQGTALEPIVNAKLRELREAMSKLPETSIRAVLDRAPEVRSFKRALLRRSPAIIAEIKRASPSVGLLRADFNPLNIGHSYQKGGAAAVSVLTEGQFFRGGLEILAGLRWSLRLPLLRKDFIVDPYQVIEARHAGADAVLLIAALTDSALLKTLRLEVENCGMDALVEVHTEWELDQALEAGASLIGVNNRDLRSLDVSLDVCLRLADRLPKHVVAVAESGIRSAADIRRLSDAGYRGFLVGESLMRADSPGAALAQLLAPAGFRRSMVS
jgi:indole-3-glycerol phosphate synthase